MANVPSLRGAPDNVRIPKAADLVAQVLRRRIVAGTLREGDPLPHEGLLMQQFNVARTTVREALRVLEAEGLVTVRRGAFGGARIKAPSVRVVARYASMLLQYEGATMSDVHEARILIEPPATGVLAHRAPNDEIVSELEAVLAEEEAALGAVNLARAEGRFHNRLVQLTANETLIMLNSAANLIIGHQYQRVAAEQGGTWVKGDDAHQAHRRLVQLIRVGAAVEAETLWRRHLDDGGKSMLQQIRDTPIADLMD